MTRVLSPGIVSLTLRERRRLIVGTAIGVAVMVGYVVAIFPSVRGNDAFEQAFEGMPDALRSFFQIEADIYTSGAGFLNVEMFSFMLPIMLLLIAIGGAAATISGEEESHRMDLVLSMQVSRTALMAGRMLGIAAVVAVLCVTGIVSVLVGGVFVDLDISPANLVAAFGVAWLYAMHYAAMTFAVAGLTGRSGLAKGIAGVTAIAGYLVASLANMSEHVEPLAPWTAYYRYSHGSPLRNGIDWSDAGMLAASIVVLSAVAIAGFVRRDVR